MSDSSGRAKDSTVTRRGLLRLIGVGAIGLIASACDSAMPDIASPTSTPPAMNHNRGEQPTPTSSGNVQQTVPRVFPVGTDYSARFAGFEAADEPNGDLSKVVWPDFVTSAPPEVIHMYEFQILNGDLMKYMPCFCGCFKEDGHLNNRDCYIKQVNTDGSVVFDTMAPT